MGYTLYHLVWLGYDLAHLNSPTSWFFAAMMIFAIWRGVSRQRGRRRKWHRMI